MDSDFMNNLAGMMKNGNIPDDIKNLMNSMKNNTQNSNSTTDASSNNSSVNNFNPDMLKNIMNMFNNSKNNTATDANGFDNPNNMDFTNNFSNSDNSNNVDHSNIPNIDINMLFKMKSVMDKMNTNKNDPRSNLLLSLKPYLKESRKSKIEQYVQFFNMTKVIDAFNQNGGDSSK